MHKDALFKNLERPDCSDGGKGIMAITGKLNKNCGSTDNTCTQHTVITYKRKGYKM